MVLNEKIVVARKGKGMTQETLADLAKVTVRTIQRIEKGESIPRDFTLKAIATALDTSFEEFAVQTPLPETATQPLQPDKTNADDPEETFHFLRILCLSCFSFIVIPYVHFLIQIYLLKKKTAKTKELNSFARKLIRRQINWVVTLHLSLLLALVYNFCMATYFNRAYPVSYLGIVFFLYALNTILIFIHMQRIKSVVPTMLVAL